MNKPYLIVLTASLILAACFVIYLLLTSVNKISERVDVIIRPEGNGSGDFRENFDPFRGI